MPKSLLIVSCVDVAQQMKTLVNGKCEVLHVQTVSNALVLAKDHDFDFVVVDADTVPDIPDSRLNIFKCAPHVVMFENYNGKLIEEETPIFITQILEEI